MLPFLFYPMFVLLYALKLFLFLFLKKDKNALMRRQQKEAVLYTYMHLIYSTSIQETWLFSQRTNCV